MVPEFLYIAREECNVVKFFPNTEEAEWREYLTRNRTPYILN
jgi:hypothetical protein